MYISHWFFSKAHLKRITFERWKVVLILQILSTIQKTTAISSTSIRTMRENSFFYFKPLLRLTLVVLASLLATVRVCDAMHYHDFGHHTHPCVSYCRGLNCTYGFLNSFGLDCQCVGCKSTSFVKDLQIPSM